MHHHCEQPDEVFDWKLPMSPENHWLPISYKKKPQTFNFLRKDISHETVFGQGFLTFHRHGKNSVPRFPENVPILDYHCHINPQEIAEDRKFENITQVWLGGDHYKWRQMRSNGVEEKYITGDASDREKFQKWAETMPKLIGNPLYHWSHLELKKYFGYDGYLNGDTAEEVWNLCNAKLQDDSMTVRNIIKQSNVTLICTTDDPIDTLEWHKKSLLMIPSMFRFFSWRPDKATNIEKPDFTEYIGKLSKVSGVEVKDFASLKEAIKNRMAYFGERLLRIRPWY